MSRGSPPTSCRAASRVPRASSKTLEYLEKEYLELGLQPAAGGDFRQDVALVEITGSAQALSFSRGAGGMTLAYGDDMVIGSRRVQPQAAMAGSEVVFVGYGINAPEAGWNDYAGIDMRGKTALILVNDPGLRHRRRIAVPRQGDDLPRPLDLQVRGGLAPGRGGRDHRPRDGSRVLRLERRPEQLVRPAVLPRPRGRQRRAHRARRLDHRGAGAPADGARGPGLRRAEIGGREARVHARSRSASPRRRASATKSGTSARRTSPA